MAPSLARVNIPSNSSSESLFPQPSSGGSSPRAVNQTLNDGTNGKKAQKVRDKVMYIPAWCVGILTNDNGHMIRALEARSEATIHVQEQLPDQHMGTSSFWGISIAGRTGCVEVATALVNNFVCESMEQARREQTERNAIHANSIHWHAHVNAQWEAYRHAQWEAHVNATRHAQLQAHLHAQCMARISAHSQWNAHGYKRVRQNAGKGIKKL